LKATVAKRNFSVKIGTVKDTLELILNGIKEVMKCHKLVEVMELVLAIGNFLNGGTTRGGAYGFKLDTLTKLGDIKAASGGTLLNYVAKIAESKGIANCVDELKGVNDASRESLQTVLTDLAKLKGELALIKSEGSNEGHNAPGDQFRPIMSQFVAQATRDLDNVEKLSTETEAAYNGLCKHFVEDPKNDSIQLFETLQKFITAFDKARKENAKPAGKK